MEVYTKRGGSLVSSCFSEESQWKFTPKGGCSLVSSCFSKESKLKFTPKGVAA